MADYAPNPCTVLVVEDDPLVRMLAVDLVADTACATLEATNADEAVRLLETHPEITVLFTDVDMPGSMNGLKLAAVAKSLRPELVVIIASGCLKADAKLPAGARFFRKPYSTQEIASAIICASMRA